MKLFLFFSLFLASCNYHERKESLQQGPSTVENRATYASVVSRILEPYCLRCHSGEHAAMGVDLTLGYQSLIDSDFLIPGDAESSWLFVVIEDGSMPKKGLKPTKEEIEWLRKWISDGAKEK